MRFLRENIGLKLLALVLSVALWANVKLHQEPLTAALPVRLEVRGLPEGLVATPNNSQVTVVVYGPKAYVSALTPESLKAYVDVKGASPGLVREDVVVFVPPRLQPVLNVQSITPNRVEVQVHQKMRRQVPVQVKWSGPPIAGMQYSALRITPTSVTVAGADTTVRDAVAAQANVPAGAPRVAGRYPVVAVNAAGEPVADVSVWPNSVAVEATLVPTQSRQQAFVLPSFTGTPAKGFHRVQIWTRPQVVTLVGPPDVLSSLMTVSTRPINIDGARNDVTATVGLSVPNNVTAVPDQVFVRVQVRHNP